MKKKVYEEPILEVIKLEEEDFIKTSTETELKFPDGWLLP